MGWLPRRVGSPIIRGVGARVLSRRTIHGIVSTGSKVRARVIRSSICLLGSTDRCCYWRVIIRSIITITSGARVQIIRVEGYWNYSVQSAILYSHPPHARTHAHSLPHAHATISFHSIQFACFCPAGQTPTFAHTFLKQVHHQFL